MDIPEIDIFISGHNNILTADKFDNRIYISSGKNGEYIGIIEIDYTLNDNLVINKLTPGLSDLFFNRSKQDSSILEIAEDYYNISDTDKK